MTPTYNSPQWHAMLEQVRQHQNAARAKDQAYKAALKASNTPQTPPLFPLPDYEPPEPAPQIPQPVTARATTLQAPTITLNQFDQAFTIALETAQTQYAPFRHILGDVLYSFATVLRAAALIHNPKANAKATLCTMLPFKLVAELVGYSREYIYKLIGADTEAAKFFKRIIGWDAHVSSYWIGAVNADAQGAATQGAEPQAKPARAHDGTLFTTRPLPSSDHSSPVARFWDWRREWRDLFADVRDGRTVTAAIEQLNAIAPRAERRTAWSSHTTTDKNIKATLQIAKNFFYLSLTAFNTFLSVSSVCEPDKFHAVHDALVTPIPTTTDGRTAWAKNLATRVYQCVGDSKPDDMNGWLARAWTIAKSVVFGVGPAREVFLEALWVVLERSVSGTVKNLGAYFNSILKARGWESLEDATADLHLGMARAA
jgi:hypothetical protein